EPHKDNKGRQRYYKPLLNLHNKYIHKDRNILIHSGGKIKDSKGCLLIGSKLDKDDKGNIMRISSGQHTHGLASEVMAFLMQNDSKDSVTNKPKHLLAKNNHKIELLNVNLVIRNEFEGVKEGSKVVEARESLYLKFNGKELQIIENEFKGKEWHIVENEKVIAKTFALSAFSLNSPKNSIKEGKDYYINLNELPLSSMPNQGYTLNIYDKKAKQVAIITNKNTKNIINAEIFLDDSFAEFLSILTAFKLKYKLDKVRMEVGMGV
ncbi:hypothetical protein DMC01_12595, partial [Campylobacter troglodytis]